MAAKKKVTRGAALVSALVAKLVGPDSPIGDPQPLDAARLSAVEDAAGVALSPSLHAVLSLDGGWLGRTYGWFDAGGQLLARPTIEIIRGHAGPLAEAYEELCAQRFPGRAIGLDRGSDSMRLLYFGDPDEQGEYPVLYIDHDDLPMLGVEAAGVDVWLAEALGIKASIASDVAIASKRILGSKQPWSTESGVVLPAPMAGPAPGSVAFERAPSVPAAQKKLTDKQLIKALTEHAGQGNSARLAALLADARARTLPKKPLDDALVAAALGGHESTLRMLLEAGADPDAPSVNGKTALFAAVERDSAELTRLLLERGADPNHADTSGQTPLHEAAQKAIDPVIVDLLLDHGAQTEGGTNHSLPLHWAVDRGEPAIVARLLARGANRDATSGHLGRTPLHIAFERGDDVLAGDLVRAGADRSIPDERGIVLAEVYGPSGEDLRSLDVHYVPSREEQRLTLAVRIAVTNPHGLPHVRFPALDAHFWAELVNQGLAAGDRFDPAWSRAAVLTSFDLKKADRAGFHDAKLELTIAGVAPELLRFVAAKLLGNVVARSRGAGSAMRVVAVSIRGSLEGESVVDAKTLRAWIADDTVQLGAFPGELPFAFRVERGGAPAVAVVPVAPFTPAPAAPGAAIYRACSAWLSMSETWPRATTGPALFLMLSPDRGADDRARYTLLAPSAPKSERNRFPFAAAPAEAALRNAMRALHAKMPLREVVLTLPG